MTAWIITFLALFVTDICWAVYVTKVKDEQPLKASLWSVFLFMSGSVAVIGYTSDHWLLIPAGFGAFAGTYAGVWWSANGESTLKEKIIPPLFNIWATMAIAMMIWFPWLDTPAKPEREED